MLIALWIFYSIPYIVLAGMLPLFAGFMSPTRRIYYFFVALCTGLLGIYFAAKSPSTSFDAAMVAGMASAEIGALYVWVLFQRKRRVGALSGFLLGILISAALTIAPNSEESIKTRLELFGFMAYFICWITSTFGIAAACFIYPEENEDSLLPAGK